MRARRVRRHPLQIPRVMIGRNDGLDVFALKVMGLGVWKRIGRPLPADEAGRG